MSGMGQVMQALQQHALADNTRVVFTSDNGGERFSDSWPLVGGKKDLTEGGIRVPWIAHWPAQITPGTLSEQPCMTMDWSATLLDAAGVQADPAYPLDGVSLMPVFGQPGHCFALPLYWRMNHRDQRANLAQHEPERLAAMRADWLAWEAGMPAIAADASISLGYSAKDMPQR